MDDNDFSPEKPTKRADAPPPSISSSTIAAESRVESQESRDQVTANGLPERTGARIDSADPSFSPTLNSQPSTLNPPTLSPEDQIALLDLLEHGANPLAACSKLGVTLDEFWSTVFHDLRFAAQWQRVFDSLSHCVVGKLFQTAMGGSVSAQQFWLRQRPAPFWSTANRESPDKLEQLSDGQLLNSCRTSDITIPPEIEARERAHAGGK